MVKLAPSCGCWLLLLLLLAAVASAEKQWVDRDRVYCGHLDCTVLATFQGERFCTPCDTRHYCECKETREPLPYLRQCPGSAACQTTDRRGSCSRTMDAERCANIDQAYL